MYQEIGHASFVPNRRFVAHATLDSTLHIQSCSLELCQWSGLKNPTLNGVSLLHLFPQLESRQALIFKQLNLPGSVFTYQNARFAQNPQSDRVFDLQLETLPELGGRLLLTVVPSFPLNHANDKEKNLLMLTRHNRELLLLNRASQILTATLDLDEVLENLLQVTVQIIKATGSSVWLWGDEHHETLVCRAAFHPGTEEKLLGMEVASGKGIVGWVAEENEVAVVSDAATDGRFYPHIDHSSGFSTDSILAVPIHLRNRVLGVLEVVNKQSGRFQSNDLAYAQMLAASAAIAIDNAQLIQTLRSKMEDLKIQNAELEAFDHTVAHDLQNPLALVVGFADVLEEQGTEISQDERQQAVSLLVQNAHRMSSIIQEMLILASVRKHEVETHPLDMAEIVDGALDRLRFMMQQYEVTLTLPDSWPVADGYAPWIEEIWENYLSNALKYGGDPVEITLGSTVLADGRIKFWVRDNGQGIDPEKRHLLFTPFTQLNQIRVTGHGLGLSIVRRIMEKLGGDVDMESQPGKGSTFGFILPAYQIPSE